MNKLYEFDKDKLNKFDSIIGVDEVGRGPLAGPVVACAVKILSYTDILNLVNDSKKLTDKTRRHIYDEIKNSTSIIYELEVIDEKVIDKINILNASLLAMKNACNKLIEKNQLKNSLTLVDGNSMIKEYYNPQECVIKGDSKSLSIALASIIAKVYRDNLMIEYSKKYTHYDFDNNKGYGTKKHYRGLEEFGECEIHRKTFLKKFYDSKNIE